MYSKTGPGILVLLAIAEDDTEEDIRFIADKTVNLRIFPDESGKLNLPVTAVNGAVMAVSQFTLLGDCRKGRRPSFVRAADPVVANDLYQEFISFLKGKGIKVAEGRFQEMMDVHLVNDGPVTVLLDSAKNF